MKNNNVQLIDFINLSDKRKQMVLEWRNNECVRKWMYNSDIISFENHFNFIDSLQVDITKKYYVVLKDNNYIGVIYFTDINSEKHTAEFGLYANPNLFGQGKLLMKTIVEYGFKTLNLKTLYAEVLKKNIKAINLYHFYNFCKTTIKVVNEQSVICMERRN